MHITNFSGCTLGCIQEKRFLGSNTVVSTKHSDASQNWHKMKRLSSSNTEQSKKPYSVLRTNSSPSFVNKTKRTLRCPLHECNISICNEVHMKPEYSPKQFKGPLDDLMLKIVGERCVPHFEDTGEFDNENKTCDKYPSNEEPRIHHTNCELELKGLKESLSSYSISSLKQL